jgi:hypothetical protein
LACSRRATEVWAASVLQVRQGSSVLHGRNHRGPLHTPAARRAQCFIAVGMRIQYFLDSLLISRSCALLEPAQGEISVQKMKEVVKPKKITLLGLASPHHPLRWAGGEHAKGAGGARLGQRPLWQQFLLRFQRQVSAKLVPAVGQRIRILSTERKSASGRTAPTKNF